MKSKNDKTMARISIYDFSFEFVGHGHYRVTYTSPKTRKSWYKTIDQMYLIDATKNCEEPKQVDLNRLKRLVKNG